MSLARGFLLVGVFIIMHVGILAQGSQYQQYIDQARAMGYSDEELMTLAASRGINPTQFVGNGQNTAAVQTEINKRNRQPATTSQSSSGHEVEEVPFPIYGMSLFQKESKLTFQPDNLSSTPPGYLLGPGDELYVDIFGISEMYYSNRISPDGNLTLSNIGPIHVAGLSMEEARKIIVDKLASVYSGIKGTNPSTFVQVGLSNARTIVVHIVGEVSVPGTFSISGFSNVFNALYAAGGPSEKGTFRQVELYRNSQLVSQIDLYDLVVNGQTASNVRLESEDVILVRPYLNRVLAKGELKRPGFYEMKEHETLADLLVFSGGFSHEAYTSKVSLTRNTKVDKLVSDIFETQYSLFTLQGGDVIEVGKILDRYENRVRIEGAVFRPGNYALTDSLSLTDLIQKADGLRGDAFTDRILITHTGEDQTTSLESINLNEVLSGISSDIWLQREDKIQVFSIYDLKEHEYVKISGEVISEGNFRYSEGMTVGDLLLLANGFKQSAQSGHVEISRRPAIQSASEQQVILSISLTKELKIGVLGDTVKLMPYDHVLVRKNPNYFPEAVVTVSGEVNYPGIYTVLSKNERISDLVKRAGGLTQWAYAPGTTLIRRTEFYRNEYENEDRVSELLHVQSGLDSINSESDRLINEKIMNEVDGYIVDFEYSNENIASKAKRERLEEIKMRNPLLSDIQVRKSESIALNFEKIMMNPGSKHDLLLEEGDILIVPKELQTVRMRGQVLYPTTVKYQKRHFARYYVNQSGGFEPRAKRKNTYVVYANGEVSRTKNILGFKIYPRVDPGAEIIVPVKPLKIPMRLGDVLGMTTGLAALATIVNQIIINSQQ